MSASVLPIRPDILARIVPGHFLADLPHNPPARGYVPGYRVGQPCVCPGCHRSHWLVGRITAECAFCGTALPIVES